MLARTLAPRTIFAFYINCFMPRGCVRTSARLVTKYICNTGVHASKVDVQVIIAFSTRLNYCLKTLKSNLTQRLLGHIAMKNAKRIGRHDLNTQINELYTTKDTLNTLSPFSAAAYMSARDLSPKRSMKGCTDR